nr:TDP-N-acetylfucosamine:lipid II N-acetylfucosaminyltransferase [Pedobacter panaciterrae]
MNYHLMIDDKFINDFIIDGEKTAPGNNIYIIDWPLEKVKHVKSDKAIFAPYGTELFLETVKNISEGDKVFIHWASDAAINFVLKLPENIKIGLFFWGGDIVEIPYSMFKKTIYGPESFNYFSKYEERPKVKWNPLKPKRLLRTLGNRYWNYAANEQGIYEIRKAFFARLNYFVHWNIIDFQWVLDHYKTQAEFVYFFYNFNPVPAPNTIPKHKKHISIMLGNSDTTPNNHFEILDVLKKFKNEAIKLVIPLNYGNKEYGDVIQKRATDIFGKEKVVAIRDFMNRDAYYEVLDDVDIAVMNHYRIQAVGNVLALLYREKKVYMHERSSTYKLLSSNGVCLGNSANIENLSFQEFIAPLSAQIKKENIENTNKLFRIDEKEEVLKNLLA